MKINKLLLGTALTMALGLTVVLNQNKAAAQVTAPSCNATTTFAGSNQKIDEATPTSCGDCTVYVPREGWTEEDGLSSKYETHQETAYGLTVTCKHTLSSVSCYTSMVSSGANCPEPPVELSDTGSGNCTGTGGCTVR